MSPLAIAALALGIFIIATRLPGVLAPARYREGLLKFPRAAMPGRVLMAVVAVWAGWALFGAARAAAAEAAMSRGPAGLWPLAPPAVVIGIPVAYWLVIRYADQFLALRGVAALMLLVGNVVVRVADRSDSPWRLVVTVLVYLWVIAAIWMAIAPHHFRDLIQYSMDTDRRCRTVCGAGVAVGVVLIALGLLVY